MLDQRNGHGDLWCADGSHYCGNFANDMFHGAGVMTHASGIVYRGDWINGFPITMATKIVLLDVPESPMIIRQGQPFSIRVECRNDEDELVEDQGREIQVMAGFKYRVPKQGSALFDMIEDVEDTPIPTPFGYEVVPYPLTDQLGEVAVPTAEDDSKMSTMVRDDEGEDKGEEENEDDGQEEQPDGGALPAGREVTEELEAVANVAAGMAALLTAGGDEAGADLTPLAGQEETVGLEGDPAGQDGSRPPTPGDSAAEDAPDGTEEKAEEVTHLPPPMCSKPTLNGVCEWENLQLAPAPPMYRPFVIMEEEAGPKKKSKAAQIREKIDQETHEETEMLNVAEAEQNETQEDLRASGGRKSIKGQKGSEEKIERHENAEETREKLRGTIETLLENFDGSSSGPDMDYGAIQILINYFNTLKCSIQFLFPWLLSV
ncbi:MORN repeat-containing protein 1-like [Elysia marginata]|uniref:MORN repeat-containing protein 1-like n=1 Tax=Elysia marginata TaxID=1093978 RepID=A0AAV4G8Z5_9GAST|nr:MORN repeat-containing protein 1-like [Elysia marginata]